MCALNYESGDSDGYRDLLFIFNQLIEGGLYNEKNIISHSRIGNDISLSTTALAADSTTSSISENEAVELARWFIANDIYEMVITDGVKVLS